MVGYAEKLIMKILIIGPSPYMQHDPGLTVKEFIENYHDQYDMSGCFYHHDFDKIPIKYDEDFSIASSKSIRANWVNPLEKDGAVILLYELLLANQYDLILSFGSFSEMDFIRASIGTSSSICPWIHVLTVSNGIHDLKMIDSMNGPDFIFSYSQYQIDTINKVAGVSLGKMGILDRSFTYSKVDKYKKEGIVFGGWNSEISNLKTIFQVIEDFDIPKKCLSNYFELGDFDLDSLANQHLPNYNKKDLFCDDFSNVFIKPEHSKWDYYIESMDYFVDMSMQQGSCRSLSRAYNAGATCIVIDTPRHREFAPMSDKYILVRSNTFFSSAGYRMYIPDHLDFYIKLSKKLEVFCKSSRNIQLHNNKDVIIKKDFHNLHRKIMQGIKERIFSDFESIT